MAASDGVKFGEMWEEYPNEYELELRSDLTDEFDEDGPILIPAFPDEYTRIDYELTYYLNDINREHTEVALEYGKAGEVKNVYAYGNERIAATRVDGTTDTFLYDGRGSVAGVYGDGEVTQSLTYDPYGNVASGANQNDLIWGYNAEEYNPVTGMQYLRARYYTPATGAFLTEDTYQGDITKPITLHKYAYADNNPVNRIDPSGHFSILNGLKAIANTVVAAAKTVYTKVIKPAVNWVASKIPAPVKSTINKGVAYVYEKTVQGVKAVAQEGKAFVNDPGGYLKTKAQQAEEKVKEFVCNTKERISTFVEEHAATLKIIAGVVIIAGLAVGSVLTGGALSPLLAAAATGAVTGGGFGAVIGGVTSAATGEDWKEGVADGFLWGAVGGALAGSSGGLIGSIAAGTPGRGIAEGVTDTLVDAAHSAANGEGLSAGGIGAGLAINVGLEVVTGGGAPPGTGKAVRNAVEEAVDSAVPGAKAGVGKASDNLIFGSNTKSSQKLNKQMGDRGWDINSIKSTYDSPYTTRQAMNRATGNPATAYFAKDGSYIVVDNVTNEIVQVSNKFDPNWKPDSSIVTPYLP